MNTVKPYFRNCQDKYYYNEIPLNTVKDFKVAFKPTKWSIRKYLAYCDSLEVLERLNFMEYSIVLLGTYNAKRNKEINLFIDKIRDHYYSADKLFETDHLNIGYTKKFKMMKIKSGHNQILKTYLDFYYSGYFNCSKHELISHLSKCFDFGIHPTSLRDKYYRLDKKREKTY